MVARKLGLLARLLRKLTAAACGRAPVRGAPPANARWPSPRAARPSPHLPRTSRLLLVVAMLVAPVAPLASADGQHALVTLPLDDPAHQQLRALERGGCAAARVSPFRPYLVGRVRTALARAHDEKACRGPLLDALLARFQVDGVRAEPDTAAARDTMRGVADDL